MCVPAVVTARPMGTAASGETVGTPLQNREPVQSKDHVTKGANVGNPTTQSVNTVTSISAAVSPPSPGAQP
jgi:hypothetical protein